MQDSRRSDLTGAVCSTSAGDRMLHVVWSVTEQRQAGRMRALTELECRRLLKTVAVGRLGLTERALPVIVPVPFTVSGDDEVIVHATATVVAGVGGGAIVAFEADEWDPLHGRGWSVSAVGPSWIVTAPERIVELDRLGFAGAVDSSGGYLAVQLSQVRGQALDHSLGGAGDLERAQSTD